MRHSPISSSVSWVAVVVDDSFFTECLGKLFGALITVHTGGILVDGSARSMNHVGHDNFIEARMGSLVWYFCADGQVIVFLLSLGRHVCQPREASDSGEGRVSEIQ
jgi:hypothetical protein